MLSDETLRNLERADEPTFREIAAAFAYWDDIHTHFRGTVCRSSGHGFSGIRRLALLQILQRRAEALGVRVRYGVVDEGLDAHADADLIVAADGINSGDPRRAEGRVRAARSTCAATASRGSARGCGCRASRTRSARTASARARAVAHPGIWNLHAYEFTQPDAADPECTIVIETTDEAFRASGLGETDEAATARFVERLFADMLDGHEVLTNRSHWRRFPTITCKTWHHAIAHANGRQGARRAARRRGAHRALLDRLGDEARARGRDRAACRRGRRMR